MQFTLKHLRYFVAAAERGSVTAAARAIHVSQPSISEAIAHLEAVFDLQLFLRHHAQGLSRRRPAAACCWRPQPAGPCRRSPAKRPRIGGRAGRRPGCRLLHHFASLLMPGLLGAFAARFPDIHIRLHEDHTEALLASLRGGRFDLALTYDLNLGADLAFERWWKCRSTSSCRPHARAPSRGVAERAGQRAARAPRLPQSRDYFLSVFYGLGLQPRVAHETPSFEMVRGSSPTATATPSCIRAGERAGPRRHAPGLSPGRREDPPDPARPRPPQGRRPRRMATAFAEFCRSSWPAARR